VLIVGINPSPWTALVNAPFAGTSNRFWKSLFQAGMTPYRVEAVTGFQPQDETMLAQQGLGIINLVSRATVRASELSSSELRSGGTRLIQRVSDIRPDAVAIVGVTAFRTAYSLPGATIGKQSPARVFGQADTEENIVAWPAHTPLWVLPNPSGLNAHETVESLANKWREVWRSVPT
jgi:TDG/mug DNA glycosylase family protein